MPPAGWKKKDVSETKKESAPKVPEAAAAPRETIEATKREIGAIMDAKASPVHPSVSLEPPKPTVGEEVEAFLAARENFHEQMEAEESEPKPERREDPEIAAMRRAGYGDSGPEAPAPARPVAREDPEIVAYRRAEESRKEEMRERLAAHETVDRNPKTGSRLAKKYRARRSPMKSGRRFTMPDVTAIDPKLIQKTEEGHSFIPEWVSLEDTLGKGQRSWNRVEQKLRCGAEIIRDGEGKPLVSGFGLAMQTHPDDYADLVVAKSPVGAFNPDAMLEPVFGIEREAGKRREGAIVVHQMQGHGRSRSREGLDREGGDTRFLDE